MISDCDDTRHQAEANHQTQVWHFGVVSAKQRHETSGEEEQNRKDQSVDGCLDNRYWKDRQVGSQEDFVLDSECVPGVGLLANSAKPVFLSLNFLQERLDLRIGKRLPNVLWRTRVLKVIKRYTVPRCRINGVAPQHRHERQDPSENKEADNCNSDSYDPLRDLLAQSPGCDGHGNLPRRASRSPRFETASSVR